MGLNPAFATQNSKPLAMLFGYGNGSGNEIFSVTDPLNNSYGFFAIFDGETDGYEQFAITAEDHIWTFGGLLPAVVEHINKPLVMHMHLGQWTPIGIPNTDIDIGPAQGFDKYFTKIPTVTPSQSLSNITYAAIENPVIPGFGNRGVDVPFPVALYGVFRGSRCRYFDASGNVTGYGFTTNPVWHRIEAILRYKIKRQQPQIAGLTDAEKGCFNWPSIVALAARNDYLLANGFPRFMGNYVFAAESTLGSMLETMCRSDRSYLDTQDGQIGFYGHDYCASSFALNLNHIYPGTWQLAKKDLTKAPNVFVPNYRDLNIAALIKVNTLTINNTGNSEGASSIPSGVYGAYFDTGGVNPFVKDDILYYGDSDTPAVHGDYIVSTNIDPSVTEQEIWCNTSSTSTVVANGGYIGSQDSRFGQRAPTTVQHRRHQKASGQIARGVTPLPNIVPVNYDLGNMTYDQAYRLMLYECNSTLGIDEDGWVAPSTGSVKVRLEAVDANGNAFIRMRPGEAQGTFAVDDTVAPEYVYSQAALGLPALFVITQMKVIPPNKQEPLGAIQISFKTAPPPAAYPDISAPPDDSLRTIASAVLPQLGKTLQRTNVAWTIQATPVITGTTMTIPDLTLQVLGDVGFRKYPGAVWGGLPSVGPVYLYVDDPSPGVTPPAFGFVTAPPSGWPATRYPVFAGGITTVAQ